MKLLIDTHVLIWATTNSGLLSGRAAALISERSNEVYVSAVSAYEIEFKRSRDAELQRMPADLDYAVHGMGFSWLPVTWRHASEAGRLPLHHRDPWDRLIIAQALSEGATLVSTGSQFSSYSVPLEW